MSKFDMIRSILSKNRHDMSGTSQRVPLIAGCVIREIKKDMRADIYVPALATVLMGVRVVFPSLGDKQGDIMSPAENSEGLYIITTEGHRFVLGGVSPTENYFPHQIMPRESERYNERAFQKMDRMGGVTTASAGCAVSSLMGDGKRFDFQTHRTELSLHREFIESEVRIKDDVFMASVTRYYRKISPTTKDEKDPVKLLEQADLLAEKVNQFLADAQNEQHGQQKPDYTPYLMRRTLHKVVQEGLVFKKVPVTSFEMSRKEQGDLETHNDEKVVYRETYYCKDGFPAHSCGITESGLKI